MARKRFIDPRLFSDSKFVSLPSDGCKLFFIGVFTNCDDYGRILWQHRSLIGDIFPMDDTKSEDDVKAMMTALVSVGLAHAYTIDGVTFAHLPNWLKYQNPNHPSPSKIPNPTCCKPSRNSPESFTKGSRNNQDPDKKDSGKSLDDIVRDSLLGLGMGLGWVRGVEELSPLLPDVQRFVALVAGENKTGRIAETRVKSLIAELGGVLGEAHDIIAFRDGLREANSKGKPNANYVRACVRSALQRKGVDSMPKRRTPQYRELA